MDCSICEFPYTASQRVKIQCEHCDFICCKQCLRKWITRDNNEIICNNCRKEFTLTFISNNLPKYVLDQCYTKLAKRRLELEIKLLPETQSLASCAIEMKQIENEIVELSRRKKKLQNQLIELDHKYHRLKSGANINDEFIAKCPTDNCNGHLNINYNCSICKSKYCTKCFKTLPHICQQQDIDTYQLLKQNSKPCPKCGINIQRIEGCNDMFCTKCKTCFDYNTLIIEKTNTNPHYHDWKNKQDITISKYQYNRVHKHLIQIYTPYALIELFNRIFEHIQQLKKESLLYEQELHPDKLLQFRIRYLDPNNTYDEKKWISSIKSFIKIEHLYEIKRDLSIVMINTLSELLLNLRNCTSQDDILYIIEEIELLRQYINTELENNSIKYNIPVATQYNTTHWIKTNKKI